MSKKLKIDNNNNNNKKLFSNLIDFEIIEHLINYLLINKSFNHKNNNEYSIKRYYKNINEIIKYCLVSTKWYEFISTLISSHIRNDNIIENWFDCIRVRKDGILRPIYDISINKEYSIIKIDSYIIKDYFKEQVLVKKFNCMNIESEEQEQEQEQKEQEQEQEQEQEEEINIRDQLLELYRKIKLNIRTFDNTLIDHLFNSSYALKICNSNKTELNIKYYHLLLPYHTIQDNSDYIKTNKLYLINEYHFHEYGILKKFQAKHIVYDPYGSYTQKGVPSPDYTILFSKGSTGDRVESIRIVNTDHVEPIDIIAINQFSNIHTVSMPVLIHDIIKGEKFNGCYDVARYEGRFRESDVASDWREMLDSLITTKSLKSVTLSNYCIKDGCLKEHQQCYNISKGILNLLLGKMNIEEGTQPFITKKVEKKQAELQYLKLYNFKFKLFSAVELVTEDYFGFYNARDAGHYLVILDKYKTTIKTLVLENNIDSGFNKNENIKVEKEEIVHLFSNILTLNNFSSIKHLKLKIYSPQLTPIILEQLFKNINNLNLYSITLYIDLNQINDVLKFVKLISSSFYLTSFISLKEINLSVINRDIQKINSFKEILKEFYNNNNNNNNSRNDNHSININIINYGHYRKLVKKEHEKNHNDSYYYYPHNKSWYHIKKKK